jgi:hypothetical protein
MEINSDFRDLLRNLNAAGVRYLIVGGYAVMVHTEPRYTKDLDVWIESERDNARRLLEALSAFGAPIAGVTADDFTEPEVFFQIGVDPVRVDIMTSITGLDFETAWGRRIEVDFGGVPAPVLCRADILAAKIASGRVRDRRDARHLREGGS